MPSLLGRLAAPGCVRIGQQWDHCGVYYADRSRSRTAGRQRTKLTRTPGAQFEISIDGKPRSYRDQKEVAIEAAEYLKSNYPNSEVVVKDLVSGKATAV